jgi:hypothetical protein
LVVGVPRRRPRRPELSPVLPRGLGDLLVGLNNSDDWQRATVTTSWPDTELEDYSGSAGNVTTDGSGDVAVEVQPQNWVYYAPANAL